MFEGQGRVGGDTRPLANPPLTTADLAAFLARVVAAPPASTGTDAIDRVRLLEDLKAACAGAQVREALALEDNRREAEAARGVPASRRCRGLGDEIALARRESPWAGARWYRAARTLTADLPHTLAALTRGALSEIRALTVVRETAHLTPEQRWQVDARLAGRLPDLGDRELVRTTRAFAHAVDPRGEAERARAAEKDRFVTLAPASDSMVHLAALLPKIQGLAAWQALGQATNAAIAGGEARGRTRPQVAADLFVQRLTGQETAAAVPVEVHLVMTDATLMGTADDPAWLLGHGPLPAATARDILAPDHDGASGRARVWVRRLFTNPASGHLVAMDSTRRLFDGLLRRMVLLRDDTCRTPWCDAPIRHVDHATSHAAGGETSYTNASGLCERCNHTKENPGWRHTATADRLDVTTPTAHAYRSHTPPLLRGHPPRTARSPVEYPRAG